MPKIKIEFDTELDRKEDIKATIDGHLLALTIWEIESYLRKEEKYFDFENKDEAIFNELQRIRRDLLQIITSQIGSINDYTY